MSKSKQIGTAAETAVVRFAQKNGFPLAWRRPLGGALDQGDILLDVGLIVEVKAGKAAESAPDAQVELWLQETERERENARATFAFLVCKRKGKGPASVGSWHAYLRLSELEFLMYNTKPKMDHDPVLRMSLDDMLKLMCSEGLGEPTVKDAR